MTDSKTAKSLKRMVKFVVGENINNGGENTSNGDVNVFYWDADLRQQDDVV